MNTKIGQLFIIGLKSTTLSEEEKTFIVQNNIGGVILFDRNIESPQQLRELCRSLQDLSQNQVDKAPLIISIDMEGGRVLRLKEPFTPWPAAGQLAALDSTSLTFKFAQAMGLEMKAVGINLDFAPCVDVLRNDQNVVIGDRALGRTPEHVAKIASALVRGLVKADILTCAKHFPGHGNTAIDSHEELPIDSVSLQEIQDIMLPPFKKTFKSRLDMVMTAHIKYPSLDEEWPASLSEKILKQLLREKIRYKNIIISDDLDMKALTHHYERDKIPVRALQAGVDMLLYCNDPESHAIGFEAVQRAARQKDLDLMSLNRSHEMVLKLKRKIAAAPAMDEATAAHVIGCPEHRALAQAIREGKVPEDITT